MKRFCKALRSNLVALTAMIAVGVIGCSGPEVVHAPIDTGLPGWYGYRANAEGDGTGEWSIVGSVSLDSDNDGFLKSVRGSGVLSNGYEGKTVDLLTRQEYGDVEIYAEFMIPKGSNSGIYVMGRYEIQVLDSYGKKELKFGDCGGIYETWDPTKPKGGRGSGGVPPRVNATRPPGEWQSFVITFRAPRFDQSGNKTANAKFVKVVHNGIVIHEDEEVPGPTRAARWPLLKDETSVGPILLQGDHGPVAYRNIRVTPLGPIWLDF